MLKIEKTEVVGFEAAIRGMRNPKNSWEKSDSKYCSEYDYPPIEGSCKYCPYDNICNKSETAMQQMYLVENNDLDLMTRLRNAGTDHRKFMRMITVYLDITAPLYWWKEFDTYKVGTVANSCSTMHKIADKEFTLDDFSHEHLNRTGLVILENIIANLNEWRAYFIYGFNSGEYKIEKGDKEQWWQMIQLLPSSYNQRRTIMLNYEVLANIYKSRRNHKLDEWHTLCDWIEGLPYSELITGKEKSNDKRTISILSD